jgi:hypothetical protein
MRNLVKAIFSLSKILKPRTIAITIISVSTLTLLGCASREGSGGLARVGSYIGIGPAPGGTSVGQYTVNADYNKVFAAAKTAAASLSMATITSSDQEIGLIQVKRGAAKNINLTVKRLPKGASIKIDVVNMAGFWALADPKTDTADLVKAISETLGLPVTAGMPSSEEVTPAQGSRNGADVAAPAPSATKPADNRLRRDETAMKMSVFDQQKKLSELGFLKDKPDGKFGKHTADAMRRFQSASGLSVTGTADAETIRQLSASKPN